MAQKPDSILPHSSSNPMDDSPKKPDPSLISNQNNQKQQPVPRPTLNQPNQFNADDPSVIPPKISSQSDNPTIKTHLSQSKNPQNQTNSYKQQLQKSSEEQDNKNIKKRSNFAEKSPFNQKQQQKSLEEQQQKNRLYQDQQKSQKEQDQQKSQKQHQQERSDRQQDQQRSGHDQEEQRSGQQSRKQEPSGKRCFNKLCQSKKIYKKLRSKVQHAKYRFLCRPCYESYVNNDFCEFCQQIYSSTGNSEDDDQWIGCDECNRWNHIECEQKYRNKNIHQLKDHDDTPYLCLTCTYKAKQKLNIQNKQRPKKQYPAPNEEPRVLKPKADYSKDQRIPIFNRKIQSLPSLQYFLQNYNFRLWINQNLIKDDLQTLRELGKKAPEDGKRSTKKVKID